MNMKKELRDWIKDYNWEIAGTLTYREGTTDKQADRIMRKFWSTANQAIYGNQWRPQRGRRKAIENITMLDTNAYGENTHFHLAIKLPKDRSYNISDFCDLLYDTWRKIGKDNYIAEFEEIENEEKWVDYITRKTTKTSIDQLHTYSSYIINK